MPRKRKLQITIEGPNTLKDIDYAMKELEIPIERIVPYALRFLARAVKRSHDVDGQRLKNILESSSIDQK